MSLTQRLKQGFLRMPTSKQAVLLSGSVLTVSAFLPWYDTSGNFGTGQTYLGIQSPLFLVGVMVAVFGFISFSNLFFPLMGKNFFQMRRKSGVVSIILGIQSLFLLGIANSVFFHPQFLAGTSKTAHFGMVIAFASSLLMVLSGWAAHRREKEGGEEDYYVSDDELRKQALAKLQAEPVGEPIEVANPYNTAPVRTTPISTVEVGRPNHVAPEPVRPSAVPSRPATAYGIGRNERAAAPIEPETTSMNLSGDPLMMDPKTRYKMMRQRQRMSQGAQKNMWGTANSNNTSRLP